MTDIILQPKRGLFQRVATGFAVVVGLVMVVSLVTDGGWFVDVKEGRVIGSEKLINDILGNDGKNAKKHQAAYREKRREAALFASATDGTKEVLAKARGYYKSKRYEDAAALLEQAAFKSGKPDHFYLAAMAHEKAAAQQGISYKYAYAWYTLAQALKYPEADEPRSRVAQSMSDVEINQGQTLASEILNRLRANRK